MSDGLEENRTIGIVRFEVVFASDGDALVCFIGRAGVEEGAPARIEGRDLIVSRGCYPALRFMGLTSDDMRRLSAAPAVFLNRSDDRTGHELRIVRL